MNVNKKTCVMPRLIQPIKLLNGYDSWKKASTQQVPDIHGSCRVNSYTANFKLVVKFDEKLTSFRILSKKKFRWFFCFYYILQTIINRYVHFQNIYRDKRIILAHPKGKTMFYMTAVWTTRQTLQYLLFSNVIRSTQDICWSTKRSDCWTNNKHFL